MSSAPVRTMLVWCPDWPVVAADITDGIPASTPVAVLHANRVVACSEAARANGVRRGLRRREAQSRCPGLTVVEHDPDRDARAFEPVVAAIEEIVAGVEVIRPGVCAVAARGPARYFGGEERAAERIVEHIAQTCAVESQLGIADGVFAAGLAARTGRIVPPGGTPEFLAGLPVWLFTLALRERVLRLPITRYLAHLPCSATPDGLSDENLRDIIDDVTHCPAYFQLLVKALLLPGLLELASTDVPTHLVICEKDRVLPHPRFTRHFTAQLPADTVVTHLDGVGHIPMYEAPGRVADLIVGWLDRHRGPERLTG